MNVPISAQPYIYALMDNHLNCAQLVVTYGPTLAIRYDMMLKNNQQPLKNYVAMLMGIDNPCTTPMESHPTKNTA